MKILLINPIFTVFKTDIRRCVTPIGLAYIGAILEKNGHKVNILDVSTEGYHNIKQNGDYITYGLDDKEVKEQIKKYNPDIVGVSSMFTTQINNVKHTLKLVKEVNKEIITLIGGSHPTYSINDMLKLKYIDYIIIGEGELPTLQLLDALDNNRDLTKIGGLAFNKNGKDFINSNRQYINLDELPFPARHLLNMELYFKINVPQNPYPQGKRVVQISSSRGCSARCVFCTTTNFWGNRFRMRSAKNVLTEIRELKERYNIDEVQFTDDNITLNKRRVIEILEGIKEMNIILSFPNGIAVWSLDKEILIKIKEAGCYQITLAFESGNQQVLSNIIKKPLNLKKVKPLVKTAHELGIKVHAFCVCGVPGETIEQMHETYNFAKDCGFDTASFFIASPLVGSELLNICRQKGYLRENIKPNGQLYNVGNITTPDFNAQEVEVLVRLFNNKFNKNDKRTFKEMVIEIENL